MNVPFPEEVEIRRIQKSGYRQTEKGDPFGFFLFPATGRFKRLFCMVGSGEGWDHVSVSLPDSSNRCPSWEEMCFVKDKFFRPEETVVQYHPPKSDYVNVHPGVLHLWRWQDGEFPRPEKKLV